jgi:hypothetical protein
VPASPTESTGSRWEAFAVRRLKRPAGKTDQPNGLRTATHHGTNEQKFGPEPQVAHEGKCYRQATGSVAQFRAPLISRDRYRSALPVFHRPLEARGALKLNMSWPNPDLYFFLCLLAGLAASLAIIYECVHRFYRRKPPVVEPRRSSEEVVDPPSPPKYPRWPQYWKRAKPLDGLLRERPDLPNPNPVRPGSGPEKRLRNLQVCFGAISKRHDRASKLRRYYRSTKLAALAAIAAFAVVWGLSSPWLKHIVESALHPSISPGLVLSAMQDGVDIYTIIFAALAVFIVLRLRSVLGRRTLFAPPSCSHARFRRVGLACRAQLRVVTSVPIVLTALPGNWLRMSLRGVRLQRRARLARSVWSVRVTR